jgi:hypothetical protein
LVQVALVVYQVVLADQLEQTQMLQVVHYH